MSAGRTGPINRRRLLTAAAALPCLPAYPHLLRPRRRQVPRSSRPAGLALTGTLAAPAP
jgi:hypothetical protein